MRRAGTFLVFILIGVPLSAQQKSAVPYRIDFDSGRDVTIHDGDAKTGKEGLYVTVRFTITRSAGAGEPPGTEYKVVIEEDGHRVREEDVPRPTPSEDLSIVLALDTSGSMKEHGRMAQAKSAAGVFLDKLPVKAECGLIFFDHELRQPILAPALDREPLRKQIHEVEPRGGTAYLDATAKAIEILKKARSNQQRAVVLMTDGVDLNSTAGADAVIAQARKDKVHVYTIGIGEPGRSEQVSTVLVLDHSGSMKAPADDEEATPKIEALHRAASRFVNIMPSSGRTTLIPFSSTVGIPGPFSSRRNNLETAIKELRPKGETALFDAVYAAVATLDADGARGKRAVVAMTDGVDNCSRRRVDEVIERAREGKIALYMLGFGRAGELDEKTMRAIAEQTGGKYYHAKNEKALLEIFENLSIQLHDDGIDEAALTKLASETGGQYYPAKNVQDLRFILEQVTQTIQKMEYSITFPSLRQVRDGTARKVTLKLVRHTGETASNLAGGAYQAGEQVVQEQKAGYQTHGVVVAEMDHFVYLALLSIIGVLIALPGMVKGIGKHA